MGLTGKPIEDVYWMAGIRLDLESRQHEAKKKEQQVDSKEKARKSQEQDMEAFVTSLLQQDEVSPNEATCFGSVERVAQTHTPEPTSGIVCVDMLTISRSISSRVALPLRPFSKPSFREMTPLEAAHATLVKMIRQVKDEEDYPGSIGCIGALFDKEYALPALKSKELKRRGERHAQDGIFPYTEFNESDLMGITDQGFQYAPGCAPSTEIPFSYARVLKTRWMRPYWSHYLVEKMRPSLPSWTEKKLEPPEESKKSHSEDPDPDGTQFLEWLMELPTEQKKGEPSAWDMDAGEEEDEGAMDDQVDESNDSRLPFQYIWSFFESRIVITDMTSIHPIKKPRDGPRSNCVMHHGTQSHALSDSVPQLQRLGESDLTTFTLALSLWTGQIPPAVHHVATLSTASLTNPLDLRLVTCDTDFIVLSLVFATAATEYYARLPPLLTRSSLPSTWEGWGQLLRIRVRLKPDRHVEPFAILQELKEAHLDPTWFLLSCILRGNDFIQRSHYLPGISLDILYEVLHYFIHLVPRPILASFRHFDYFLCTLYSWRVQRKGPALSGFEGKDRRRFPLPRIYWSMSIVPTIYSRGHLEIETRHKRLPGLSLCKELYHKVCQTYHYWTTWDGTIACPSLLHLDICEALPALPLPVPPKVCWPKQPFKRNRARTAIQDKDWERQEEKMLDRRATGSRKRFQRGERTMLVMDQTGVQAVTWHRKTKSKKWLLC